MSLKPYFSRFLDAERERLHFAAHSHHYWPDVTYGAQEACWQDAARLADRKWDKIFGEIVPRAQRGVAEILHLRDPAGIAFGPNTHGFVMRLLSCLPQERPYRILTTDGEFHSFARQVERLEEAGRAVVVRIATEPFRDFTARFRGAVSGGRYDLIYLSQTFYNSGFVVPDLESIVAAVPDRRTLIVIDGYHGFMALPSDLSAIQDRAFYLSGGYKYAMAGEGIAFLHAPAGIAQRPLDTGWFAAFGALSDPAANEVPYAADGSRFLGATFDPVGLYRLNAVFDWMAEQKLSIFDIHTHARSLQALFLEHLAESNLISLRPEHLVVPLDNDNRGNFLTFRTEQAAVIHARLLDAKVITDYRGDRLRFGFGVYQGEGDVVRLCERLARVLD